MPDLAQNVPILESERLEIPAFGTSKVEEYSKRLLWDTQKFTLLSAVLSLRASQTYLSGAKIELIMNGRQRLPINWNAFEVIDRAKELDVTASLFNGDNKFKLEYTIAFGAVTGQIAIVSSSLVIRLRGNRSGTSDPIIQGGLQDENFWKKAAITVRDHALLIVGSTIAVAASVAIIKTSIGRTALKGVRDIFK